MRVVEFFGLVFSLIFLTFALLPVLSFLRLARLGRELEALSERVKQLEARARVAPETALPPSPSADVATEAAAGFRPSESFEAVSSTGEDEGERIPAVATAGIEPSATVTSAHGAVPEAPLAFDSRAEIPGAPRSDVGGQPAATVPPPAAEAAQAAAAVGDEGEPDLESRIGGRGLLYTGVVVLLLGVSFFLRYAFENAWIDETGRIVLGAVAGLSVVVSGLRLARTGLIVFGHALVGTGLAILYLVIFAALNLYELIDRTPAFAGMALVTIGAALIADRRQSQALAFIAVAGGFLTPFLVGGDENAQLTLFTYDALLIGGTLFLAIRHRWMALNAASYVLTLMTVLAWTARYYTDDQWLRTLLFLTLFCVLFLIILRETARSGQPTAQLVSALLATAPVLYHIGAVLITAQHPPAIHVYLIVFTVIGLWLTAEPHRPWIRLLVLLGSFAPLFGHLTLPDGLSWILPNVVTISAVAALHMMAILDRIFRQEARLHVGDLVAMHLTGLGLFALLYQALQPAYPEFRGGLAALIALAAIGLWQSLQSRERVAALNAAGLAFTLAALGVAVEFDGPAVVMGWAAEGAAATWLGLRAPSPAFQFGGLALWALAAIRLLDDRYFETAANFTALLNPRALTTLYVVVLAYALAWLHNRSTAPGAQRIRAALHVAASVVTITWLTAEIHSYWEVRSDRPQAYLYEQMMRSLGWGLYGAALIALGMRRAYAPVRYIGITVIVMTALKVFFYDLWQLGGIYRVIGFLGFGVLLVLVSYLYQKRKGAAAPETPLASDS